MNLIAAPAAPTRIAVAHADAETVTTMSDVAEGDFVIRVHPFGRIRGMRVNSAARSIRPFGNFLSVEFTAARGQGYRIAPTNPVTIRRATQFEEV
jgi:hypothetical protein